MAVYFVQYRFVPPRITMKFRIRLIFKVKCTNEIKFYVVYDAHLRKRVFKKVFLKFSLGENKLTKRKKCNVTQ